MEKSRYQNDVMFSALSGLLFFWLVIQYKLDEKNNTWNDDEKLFVNSWCLIGNYALILLVCFFLNVIVFESSSIRFFSVFAEFFGFLILLLILISLPLLVSWKHIQFYRVDTTSEEKKLLLLSFVPFFSSFQWFLVKQYDKPNFWLKEAQLWFFITWLLLFFFNSWMVAFVLWWFLILRLIFLMTGWDVFSNEQKQRMRHRFLVYPEESFSVVYTFIRQWISLLFKKKEVSVEELLKYQESYRAPRDMKTWILTSIFCCGIFGLLYYWLSVWLYRKLIPFIWILIRIWILCYTKNKIPKMPVIAELTS